MTTFRICVLAALLATGPAAANTGRERLLECRAMADQTARLKCYDELADAAKAQTPPADTYQPMSFSDFVLDVKKLQGRKVEVTGYTRSDDPYSALHKSQFDLMSFVKLLIDELPRDDRKRLLEQCRPGCVVTVDGTAQPGYGLPEIVADSIRFGN